MSNYIKYLQKKEKKILYGEYTHGHLSNHLRVFKGWVLGFGLGNILVRTEHSFFFYLVFVFVSFILSTIFIHNERRTYNRKKYSNTITIGLNILYFCVLLSLISLLYTNFTNYILIVAMTTFFSSLAYSFE